MPARRKYTKKHRGTHSSPVFHIKRKELLVKSLGSVPKVFKQKYLKLHPRRKLIAPKFKQYVVNRRIRQAKSNFKEKYPYRKLGTKFFVNFVNRSYQTQTHQQVKGTKKRRKIIEPVERIELLEVEQAPLKMHDVDWIGLIDVVNDENDSRMQVDFQFKKIKFEGTREHFPFTELRQEMQNYLTKELNFDIDESYWRLLPIFTLERYYSQEKEKFTKTVIRPMDDWEELAKGEIKRIGKMK